MFFDDYFNLYWDDKRYLIYDKERRTRELVLYMLDRTQQIFTWQGLPETIPQYDLEHLLQICGNVCIADVTEVPEGRGDTGLYAFFGGLGGEPNAYYEPTIYTVSNPWLNFYKELKIGDECVRGRNDNNALGLMPLFMRYGALQNENEISLNMLSINYRVDNLVCADDDRTYESAKKFFNDIIAGQYGAISSSEFFEGIRNDKVGGSGKNIKDLIEYEQYLKASWYNEIGLNSNYNMKRERIVASEAQMSNDALIPLVDNMLEWRLKMCEEVREMFGDKYDLDELTVALNPIWDLDKLYVDMIPENPPDEVSERSEIEEDTENIENADTEETEEDSNVISGDTTTNSDVGNDSGDNINETMTTSDVQVDVNITIDNADNVNIESEGEDGDIDEEIEPETE